MDAVVGLSGIGLFLISAFMAFIQRRVRLRFWLVSAGIGLVLLISGLAMPTSSPVAQELGQTTSAGTDSQGQPKIQEEPSPPAQGQPVSQVADTREELAEAALDKLAAYLYENFGGGGDARYATFWWNLIDSVRLSLASDGQAVVAVATEIYPDKEGEHIGSAIVLAVLGCDSIAVKSVTVLGQGEHILAMMSR